MGLNVSNLGALDSNSDSGDSSEENSLASVESDSYHEDVDVAPGDRHDDPSVESTTMSRTLRPFVVTTEVEKDSSASLTNAGSLASWRSLAVLGSLPN